MLEVTDDGGLTDVAVQYIQISPVVVSFTYTVIGPTVIVDASGIDSDGAIVSYVWDWGDGATATGMAAVHIYSAGGTYIITLAMTFNDGSIGRISQTLTVEAVPV
jgi:PKD repeat protein